MLKSLEEYIQDRKVLLDQVSELDRLIDAFTVIEEYKSRLHKSDSTVTQTIANMRDYMSSHMNESRIAKIMSAVNSSEGTNIKRINGLIQGIKEQRVTDRILQFAWKIRIQRDEITTSSLRSSLDETITRMKDAGTIGDKDLRWFQQQLEILS